MTTSHKTLVTEYRLSGEVEIEAWSASEEARKAA